MPLKNPKAFFDTMRARFAQAGGLTISQVGGTNLILSEASRRKTPLQRLAYVLATAWWESGKTMAPVREAYYLGDRAEAFRKTLRYYPYYGRGLVQLTWKANYAKASDVVGEDLVAKPDRALDPYNSVAILFSGMEGGWFTGKDLDDYIDLSDESDTEDLREFANARRIVNGTDRQVEIGKIALSFERCLVLGEYDTEAVEPLPPPPPPPPPPDVEPFPTPPAEAPAGFWAAFVAFLLKWFGGPSK